MSADGLLVLKQEPIRRRLVWHSSGVPEEDWFGQRKYRTIKKKKKILRCIGSCFRALPRELKQGRRP